MTTSQPTTKPTYTTPAWAHDGLEEATRRSNIMVNETIDGTTKWHDPQALATWQARVELEIIQSLGARSLTTAVTSITAQVETYIGEVYQFTRDVTNATSWHLTAWTRP